MSGPRTIKLGGKDYAIGPFTVGQVSKIAPLLPLDEDYKSPAQAQASNTAIYTAVSGTSFNGTYEDFLALPGVAFAELLIARREVGRAIGLFAEEVNEKTPGKPETEESR